jgi:membrane-associated phospholipid phosphatase
MNSPASGSEVNPRASRQPIQSSNEVRVNFWRGCIWLAIAAAVLGLAFLVDEPLTRVLTLSAASSWQEPANYASRLGEGWVVGLVGVIISAALFKRRHFDAGRAAFLIALTGLITGLGATALRTFVGRTRPDASVPQGFYGVWHNAHWIMGRYEFSSFPSGHTATAVGVAVAFWLLYPRLGRFFFLYAALVGWSRIAMGCHHFSDVIAAAVFGTFGAYLVVTRLQPRLKVWTRGLERKLS